jgi:hypothetical protein
MQNKKDLHLWYNYFYHFIILSNRSLNAALLNVNEVTNKAGVKEQQIVDLQKET